MFLARVVAAASAWGHALTGPLLLFSGSAALLLVVWRLGEDRWWPVVIAGAVLLGLALGWGVWAAKAHCRMRTDRSADGEGEPR